MAKYHPGIRAKLTLSFLLVILIPIIVLGTLTYVHEKDAHNEAMADKLRAIALLKENAISDWLAEEKRLIQMLANEPLINSMALEILNSKNSDPQYWTTFSNLQNYLQEVLKDMDDIVRLSVLSNTGGREIASSDPSFVGKYHLSDSFFTLGRNQTYIQQIKYNPKLEEPVMIIATPISDNKGNQHGVLYAVLDPDWLTLLMSNREGLGNTGHTYLVDTRQKVVTPQFAPSLINQKLESIAITQALNRQAGEGRYLNALGTEVIGVYRWLEEPRVALIAEINESEIFKHIDEFVAEILIICSLIAGLAFSIAIFFSARLTAPINDLTKSAEEIAYGNYEKRVPVTASDEIGKLSSTFNKMTDSLRKTMADKEDALGHLQETNRKLEKATHAKSSFITNMSHELRTPLNAVIGLSELLAMDIEEMNNPMWIDYINSINVAGQHLMEIINDILDFSKIEDGKIDLHYEEFNIDDLVKQIKSIVQPLTEKNHNNLKIEGLHPDMIMTGDTTRIRQILFNLLGNAAKFTHDGTITLQVEQTIIDDQESFTFRIIDTGIGIPKDRVDAIFDVFTQADSSLTKAYGGTGLGLTIAKQLAEKMGGSLCVESVENVGATFTLNLPAKPADDSNES